MARASGWAGQKGSAVLGFSAMTEPVLPVACAHSYVWVIHREHRGLGTWLLIQYSMWIRILLTYELRSDLGASFFLLRACRAYVPTTCMCTMLHTICDHYLTHVATIEIVTLLTEHEIGLRSDLLASNVTKFLWGNPELPICYMARLLIQLLLLTIMCLLVINTLGGVTEGGHYKQWYGLLPPPPWWAGEAPEWWWQEEETKLSKAFYAMRHILDPLRWWRLSLRRV